MANILITLLLAGISLALGSASPALADTPAFINVFSTRGYARDHLLFGHFTLLTGIAVRTLEGEEDEVLADLKRNQKSFPPDVFLANDIGALAKADSMSLLEPLLSATVEERVPIQFRQNTWFVLSSRARIIALHRKAFSEGEITTYEDLTKPELRGVLCGPNNQPSSDRSLLASMIAHLGESTAENWMRGLTANRARSPKLYERDHLRWIAAGDCDVALVDTPSLTSYLRSSELADSRGRESVTIVWPNQESTGTHVIYSGGAIARTSTRKDAARKFLEFMLSDAAQRHMAENYSEWPVVTGINYDNPLLKAFSNHRLDNLSAKRLAELQESSITIAKRFGIR